LSCIARLLVSRGPEQEALENIQAAIQDYLAAPRDSIQGGEIREVA